MKELNARRRVASAKPAVYLQITAEKVFYQYISSYILPVFEYILTIK